MGDFWSLFVASEERSGAKATQDQNAARLAFSVHNMTSKGVGQFRVPGVVDFDVTFLQRPIFTQGAAVKSAANAEWLDPVGVASVWRWKRNTKGHYTGAWIALSVSVARVDATVPTAWPDGVSMIHDLVFMGPAYKDLGSRVTVAAQTTATRTPGFGRV